MAWTFTIATRAYDGPSDQHKSHAKIGGLGLDDLISIVVIGVTG